MTDSERRAGESENQEWAQQEDPAYEPPRLVAMGSVKELTRGGTGPGQQDQVSFSEA